MPMGMEEAVVVQILQDGGELFSSFRFLFCFVLFCCLFIYLFGKYYCVEYHINFMMKSAFTIVGHKEYAVHPSCS